MISKLKQCCGYEYTFKLQQMFTDIKLSASLNTAFTKTEVGGATSSGVKFLVLQSGAWALGPDSSSDFHVSLEQVSRFFHIASRTHRS